MTDPHSDALVFFGATGDLAYKKIFPVLKAGTPVYEYEPTTWGPREVAQNVAPAEGWQNPIVAG
jgi:hypothetical protein